MNHDTQAGWEDPLPWRALIVRAVIVSVVVLVAYFTLPFTTAFDVGSGVVLTVGLAVIGVLLVWHIRAIRVSPYPRAKGVETVALVVPLFFVVFATGYHVMSHLDPVGWSEQLSRLDALYFTVTVFATVGFGDIHAVSQTARAVVTVQMLSNLILIGLVTRVIVHAVQAGISRQQGLRAASGADSPETGDPA